MRRRALGRSWRGDDSSGGSKREGGGGSGSCRVTRGENGGMLAAVCATGGGDRMIRKALLATVALGAAFVGIAAPGSQPLNANPLTGVTAISSGWDHACVLIKGGSPKCWGGNFAGQVGDGTTTGRVIPVEVAGLDSGIVAISAGQLQTCALTTDKKVKCWGRLGCSVSPQSVLEPTEIPAVQDAIAIASGSCGNSCAVIAEARLRCWSGNLHSYAVPELDGTVAGVSVGTQHGCVLTTARGAKCWGRNDEGRLGDGTTIDSNTPVDVIGLAEAITSVSAGGYHTCAVTASGGAKCWGNNFAGQLGDGTLTSRATPTNVLGLESGVSSISSGEFHTCARMVDFTVKCWGQRPEPPTQVPGLTGVTEIEAGGLGYQTLGLTASGSVKCWSQLEGWDCPFGGRGPTDVVGLAKPDHKVLFVNGINTESYCFAGGFSQDVEWMVELLRGQVAGYAWANELAEIESDDDFLYFDYTSDGDAVPQLCSSGHPDYRKRDTCWSLDDGYRRYFSQRSVSRGGQAPRLAAYIGRLLSADPGLSLTIIGFSQGGLLSAASVDRYMSVEERARIDGIVTFDSPLQGIPGIASPFLCQTGGGGQFDSPWDMRLSSDFVLMTTTPPYPNVPLYAINRVGVLDLLDGFSTTIPRWSGYNRQISIGTPEYGHTWGPQTRAFDGRTQAQELERLRRFVICAVAKLAACRFFADAAVPAPAATLDYPDDRQLVSAASGALVNAVDVPGDSRTLSVIATSSPSDDVRLVTPSGGVITSASDSPGFEVLAVDGAWIFEIQDPETGRWHIKTSSDPSGLAVYWDIGPASAADVDGDEIRDSEDNCTGLANPDQIDRDSDGLGDACDGDDDADGVKDGGDNCLVTSNPDQADADNNGLGDACDAGGLVDTDGDGVVDNSDNCSADSNDDQVNEDGDSLGSACDEDDDADGCADLQEVAGDPGQGGRRNPIDFWDFFDTPDADNLRDRVVSIADITRTVLRFGATGSASIDPLSAPDPAPAYHTAFDRTHPAGTPSWMTGPPDGRVTILDITLAAAQFGHTCA